MPHPHLTSQTAVCWHVPTRHGKCGYRVLVAAMKWPCGTDWTPRGAPPLPPTRAGSDLRAGVPAGYAGGGGDVASATGQRATWGKKRPPAQRQKRISKTRNGISKNAFMYFWAIVRFRVHSRWKVLSDLYNE